MSQAKNVRKPIQRSVVVGGTLFALVLVVVLSIIAYFVLSSSLYTRFETKLRDVINHVEHTIDADDLSRCIQTATPSAEYDALQQRLNLMVDDFELEYLYLVIPTPDAMTNVVSAASAKERAAGETDLPLLMASDAYSAAELERYLSYWDTDTVSYFQESSAYGDFYTAVKPLKDSSGNTIALMCADLSIDALRGGLLALLGGSVVVVLVLVGIFGATVTFWIRRNITTPLLSLEKSAQEFASRSHSAEDVSRIEFVPPDIHTGNEVESLSQAIEKMAGDIRAHVDEVAAAQTRAKDVERENARLADEAEAAAKIATLSQSVTALLTNMPGLSFSKDVETGVYLACNQAFAEYAHKSDPSGVIGLTDHEIFDEVTAQHFIEDDKIALSMDEPYRFFEDVFDAAGNPKQFHTTKMKFHDAAGRLCTLGMCVDVTDLLAARNDSIEARRAYEEAREASVTYYSIAQALSVDYLQLYYVDIDTGRYTTYHHEGMYEDLLMEHRGENFFDADRKDVRHAIYEADLEAFRAAIDKENVLRSVEDHGTFAVTYRVVIDGEPVYMSMKASRIEGDEGHLVVGISNVDAQMKQQDAARRMEEEQATIERISALSGDYLAIYAVDPETGAYEEYSAVDEVRDIISLQGGEDFFKDAVAKCEEFACRDDFGMIQSLLVKERVISEAKEHGVFALSFRLMAGDEPIYVSLRAALVEERDGPQLIVGLINIDAQVKREKEFADVQDRANRDALTGVKNKHAYADAEAALDRMIEEGGRVEFGMVVCDLNDLKLANDTKGHLAGDSLLKQACSIICNVFKHSPVFRVGGDEFAVILQGNDYVHADELLTKLEDINQGNTADGGAVVAWGAAFYQGDARAADVFSRADAAMYKNKRSLKGAE